MSSKKSFIKVQKNVLYSLLIVALIYTGCTIISQSHYVRTDSTTMNYNDIFAVHESGYTLVNDSGLYPSNTMYLRLIDPDGERALTKEIANTIVDLTVRPNSPTEPITYFSLNQIDSYVHTITKHTYSPSTPSTLTSTNITMPSFPGTTGRIFTAITSTKDALYTCAVHHYSNKNSEAYLYRKPHNSNVWSNTKITLANKCYELSYDAHYDEYIYVHAGDVGQYNGLSLQKTYNLSGFYPQPNRIAGVYDLLFFISGNTLVVIDSSGQVKYTNFFTEITDVNIGKIDKNKLSADFWILGNNTVNTGFDETEYRLHRFRLAP